MKELIAQYTEGLNAWLVLLLLLALAIGIGMMVSWLFFKLLKWNGRRFDKKSLYNVAIRDLERPVIYFVVVLLAINTVDWIPMQDANDSIFPFTEDSLNAVQIFIRMILYVVSAWTLMRIVDVFIELIKDRNHVNVEMVNNLQQRKIATQLQFIKKISSVIIVVLATSLILLEFEEVRKIGTGLLTSAGVAGIIIGFAAQKSIANLLAGLQIAFTQPMRIDDVVVLEGEFGRIEEITLTYVVVRVWDQRRIIVPLNYFIEKPFQNWTRFNAELLGTVFVYTDYEMPIDALREELHRITDDHPLWDQRTRNVLVTDLSADTMTIRILVSARSSADAFDLRCEIREKMVTFIQVNYPHCLPKTRVEMDRPGRNNSSVDVGVE
ncbi:MAG: mechanosensitive ion channel domain-containing protein [Bacteroidota bacterium]